MADTEKDQKTGGNPSAGGAEQAANKPVAKHGDHDRVAMLSVKADGTPDQLNPEFIVDRESAERATTEQFRQQAVSAADVEVRGASTAERDRGTTITDGPEDPEVEELQKAHEKAAEGAESSAKSAVDALLPEDDKSDDKSDKS